MSTSSVTLNDLEFVAEETDVFIMPKLSMPLLPLPSREAVGPFRDGAFGSYIGLINLLAGVPLSVPLWLALALKKQRKCVILSPEWLKHDALADLLAKERKAADGLTELPFHFFEVAHLLITYAAEDLTAADRVRSLVDDLDNVRRQKIEISFHKLLEVRGRTMDNSAVPILNLCAIEANRMRPQMLRDMNQLAELHRIALVAGVVDGGDKRSMSAAAPDNNAAPRVAKRNLRG